MAVFHSRPSPSDLSRRVQKHPALFGVPFVLLMVAASYGLTMFTQTRYDLHDQKVKQVSTPWLRTLTLMAGLQMTKEQELKLKKDRKKFDIREEYFVRLFPRSLRLGHG